MQILLKVLIQSKYLNSTTPNGMPLHRVSLKMFPTVILLRNLDPNEGLCNGTKLIIRAFYNQVIIAEIATGVHKHNRMFIPRIVLTSSESELPFTLRRRQFPILLAYCITINKGQGQSLETVGLSLAMVSYMLNEQSQESIGTKNHGVWH